MLNKLSEPVEGASCAVDKSCCGGNQTIELQQDQSTSREAISCELNPSEMPERVARWKALFAMVKDHQTISSTAVFQFENTPDLRSELVELVKLERICCADVSWTLNEVPDGLTLTLISDTKSLRTFVTGFLPATDKGANDEKR